jgi:hypothetical protein
MAKLLGRNAQAPQVRTGLDYPRGLKKGESRERIEARGYSRP